MSGEWTGERIRSALAQLTRQQPDLSQLDHAIMTAFERLMQGRPELTDGAVTVTNICVEAGVSRASYYRSPVAPIIKTLLTDPDTTCPELEELRAEVKRLRQAERTLRRQHAAEQREMKDTIATYANHIQLLTLANAELRADNHTLQQQAARHTNLRVLDHDPAHRKSQ